MARKATTTKTKVADIPGRKKYKKDFLSQVIVRIDFAEPLAIPKKGPPEEVVAAIRKQFPIPELRVQQLKELAITLDNQPRETTREIREWNYHSKARDKRAVVTAECMLVEYTKYSLFEVLQEDFLRIVDSLFRAFKELQVKRLGLRYIDKISLDEPNPTDWNKYLDKNLWCSFSLVEDPATIVRGFHVLEQKFDDESRLRFQFGMPNPDYPATIHRKLFVLDSDASCDLLLTRDEIVQFLSIFHRRCVERFERVITKELRRRMGVKNG